METILIIVGAAGAAAGAIYYVRRKPQLPKRLKISLRWKYTKVEG